MAEPSPTPTIRAAKVSCSVCEHGSFWILLHDRSGEVFASASLDTDTATDFLELAAEKIEAFLKSALAAAEARRVN